MVETVRPGTRAAVAAISAANARTKRASSIAAWRTWLLKSQYGHFERQNGQWMYTPKLDDRRSAGASDMRSSSDKASLRQLEKRAGAMRKARTLRRQPMLFLAAHLAERPVVTVGQEHRIVAEALVAARRPDQHAIDAGLEFLHMVVRPGNAQRRDEVGASVVAVPGRAGCEIRFDLLHGAAEVLVGTG